MSEILFMVRLISRSKKIKSHVYSYRNVSKIYKLKNVMWMNAMTINLRNIRHLELYTQIQVICTRTLGIYVDSYDIIYDIRKMYVYKHTLNESKEAIDVRIQKVAIMFTVFIIVWLRIIIFLIIVTHMRDRPRSKLVI